MKKSQVLLLPAADIRYQRVKEIGEPLVELLASTNLNFKNL
jgi:hypothetical protein